MTFGKKLFKLRKEKGLSQEQLAEQMNTTRQAVSKWENDQGFPETEKLMMLGNIFSVSIDYLLKNSGEADGPAAGGYYVSREKAQSWLSHESRFARNLCLSISCLVCSGIPYFLLGSTSAGVLGCVVVAVLGLCGVLVTCLTDWDYEYRPLKQNALLFDQAFLQELSSRYARLKNGMWPWQQAFSCWCLWAALCAGWHWTRGPWRSTLPCLRCCPLWPLASACCCTH